jgi:hypothetical protein
VTTYFAASMIASGITIVLIVVMFRLQWFAVVIPMLALPFALGNGLVATILRMQDDSYGVGVVVLVAIHGAGCVLALAFIVALARQRSFRLFD